MARHKQRASYGFLYRLAAAALLSAWPHRLQGAQSLLNANLLNLDLCQQTLTMLNDPERELRTMLERLAGDDEEWLLVAAEVLGKATKMTKDLIREADDDKARRRVQKLIELAGRSAHENPPAASLSAVLSAVLEQALGPVQQLLHIVLLGGLKPTAPSSTCAEKEYRLEAARFYYGAETVPEKLMCMVTGEVLDASSIRAGHIYRQEWNRSLLEYTASMTINDVRNLLFMRKQVEQKFDAFQITIIPQQEEGVYQVAVLDPELLTPKQMYIGLGSGADTKKWADLQEQSLHLHELLPDRRPAARLLAMHATLAVDWAEKHNWVGKGQWKVPEAGWRSPGFDPTQMRKFLDTLDTLEKVKKFTTGAQP